MLKSQHKKVKQQPKMTKNIKSTSKLSQQRKLSLKSKQLTTTKSFFSTTSPTMEDIMPTSSTSTSTTTTSPPTTSSSSPTTKFSTSRATVNPFSGHSNRVLERSTPKFPHPIFKPPSVLSKRYQDEADLWATSPKCKATIKPSYINLANGNLYGQFNKMVAAGATKEIQQLLSVTKNKSSIDLNWQDFFGWTPLTTASKRHYYGLVVLLLDHGADPNYPAATGPPLFQSIATLDIPISRKLIEFGADINYRSPTTGQTCLMVAASVINAAYPLFVLENGADVNIQDINGRSALMYSAKKSTQQVCSILLESGADPSLTDVNGLTALDYAKQRPDSDKDKIGLITVLEAFTVPNPTATATTM